MIRLSIIGFGYWGPNLVRCFDGAPECQVAAVCDQDSVRLDRVRRLFPKVKAISNYEEAMNPNMVDAVAIATPTKTHYALAKMSLERGLHTFVEKPLATSTGECQDLINVANAHRCLLFVGHVFLYSAPVAKLRQLVHGGELGEICYISSTRLNLGPIRKDVNALWDLAPHDVSIMLDLMGTTPRGVSCSGLTYLSDDVHDVCSLAIDFDDHRMGLVHVSWLDPHKKRVMTVVGNRKMAVYDDLEPLEKIKVYDHRVEHPPYTESFEEFQYSYHYGDTYCPRLEQVEPLKAECRTFMQCILNGEPPKTDGHNGLAVVQVIEAADQSLRNGQGRVTIGPSAQGPTTSRESMIQFA
jgi:predicted dehydrogenase